MESLGVLLIVLCIGILAVVAIFIYMKTTDNEFLDNSAQIKKGMDKERVVEILGKPAIKRVENNEEVYLWGNIQWKKQEPYKKALKLTFLDNKVAKKSTEIVDPSTFKNKKIFYISLIIASIITIIAVFASFATSKPKGLYYLNTIEFKNYSISEDTFADIDFSKQTLDINGSMFGVGSIDCDILTLAHNGSHFEVITTMWSTTYNKRSNTLVMKDFTMHDRYSTNIERYDIALVYDSVTDTIRYSYYHDDTLMFVATYSKTHPAGHFWKEEKLIRQTIQTNYKYIAQHYITNTISFTNVLEKDAQIEITLKYNNGAQQTDVVFVASGEDFTKSYEGGYSNASFTIKILSLV